MPSELELARSYRVSRITVRTALKALESQGLVEIRHGSGTYVADFGEKIRAGLQELRSITETIRELGREPGMEWRSLERRPATAEEARRLDLPPAAMVLAIERAVLADGEVVAYSYDTVRLDGLPPNFIDLLGQGSTFAAFEQVGVTPVRAFAALHAVRSDSVGWGSSRPVNGLYLLLDQVHFTAGSQPLMYSRTYFVEGRFEFVILRTR
jgi:GntR family transcriptional regulator